MLRIAVLFAIVTMSPTAGAAPAQPERRGPPDAGMTFRGEAPEAPVDAAPALHTDVAIEVSGVVARVRVRQSFKNPNDGWAEGVYVFPLPDKAAVDELRMRIGERIVEGEIRERSQARKVYDQARRKGQRTGLIEQERPNIFTASVANIPPRGDIVIEVGYQQRLRFADGIVELRFPSVVGPRFIPGSRAVAGVGGTGWAFNSDIVPDAERITPPVRHPAAGPANPLTIRVRLDPGMPIAMLRSPSHAIDAGLADDGRYDIALTGGDTPANRDFVLHWHPDGGDAPFAALFSETVGDDTYLMAIVAPPDGEARNRTSVPREVTFVIDTSGSMHGQSIAQARAALQFALRRLHARDRFNIVRFASEASALFAHAEPADAARLAHAARWVGRLEADGGTNIASALARALDGRIGGPRLRQVVLITDGSVGNEAALYRRIRRDIGDSRLFTVGIGSAPNGHFMRRAATFGRGTFTHIGSTNEVARTMSALFEKLEQPALTRIALSLDGNPLAAQWPVRPPDLYHGEPLVLTARLPAANGALSFSGMRGTQAWVRDFSAAAVRPGTGIAKLWARDGIAALIDGLALGTDPEAVRGAVLELALTHGLVSKYTSLVSVDRTPVRPAGAALERSAVPTELPAGWTYAKVFGARGATPATLHLVLGAATVFFGGLLFAMRRRTA